MVRFDYIGRRAALRRCKVVAPRTARLKTTRDACGVVVDDCGARSVQCSCGALAPTRTASLRDHHPLMSTTFPLPPPSSQPPSHTHTGGLRVVAPDALLDTFFDPAVAIEATAPEEVGAVPEEDDILGALDLSSGMRQAEVFALFSVAALSKEVRVKRESLLLMRGAAVASDASPPPPPLLLRAHRSRPSPPAIYLPCPLYPPPLAVQWYVVNAETQVAACLCGGFFTMYLMLREPLTEWYADEAKVMLAEQNKSEKLAIMGNERIVEFARSTVSLPTDIQAAAEEKVALITLEHEAKAMMEKHAIRDDFVRKLDSLVTQAQDAERQQYKNMVNAANVAVRAASSQAAFKKSALQFAIDAIADPKKVGKNPVIALYETELAKLK